VHNFLSDFESYELLFTPVVVPVTILVHFCSHKYELSVSWVFSYYIYDEISPDDGEIGFEHLETSIVTVQNQNRHHHSQYPYKRKGRFDMTINELYSYYNTTAVPASNNISNAFNVTSDDETALDSVGSASSDKTDSYVSTITAQATELRSENYNDILNQIKQARAAIANGESSDEASTTGNTATDETTDSASADAAGSSAGAGGSGGASSDDDEEETSTSIVIIDGQRYLETTTTNSDGSTTVTRTPIGVSAE
jgi:hypothetical protein